MLQKIPSDISALRRKIRKVFLCYYCDNIGAFCPHVGFIIQLSGILAPSFYFAVQVPDGNPSGCLITESEHADTYF